MSNLEKCIELLEEVGADVLDVGCPSQENAAVSNSNSGVSYWLVIWFNR
ncbi:MAG: hypothetical protein AAFP09_00930 [Cyanobacteria bacterium J06607_10]